MADNGELKPEQQSRSKIKLIEWRGAAVCPGSCGELVQGTWNGVNFLVSCPVNLVSRAQVSLQPNCPLTGPKNKPKALEAVRKTLAILGKPELGGTLEIDSQIPSGKGMASSTADIGAAIAATAAALGKGLSTQSLAELAVAIEPTDGTLLPGITLFDHVGARWRLALGRGPRAGILIADLGGEVDTLQFNARPELAEKNRLNEPKTRRAFYLVRRGINEKKLTLLGQGATLSAIANQAILVKPLLEELIAWAKARDSFGVIAAHSGTVLGLIYPPERDLNREEERLRAAFPQIAACQKTELTEGGVKVVAPDGNTRGKFAGSTGQIWQERVRGF